MTNLELFMDTISAMEGLDVSLKVGKESELIIKGDFMKIAKTLGTVFDAQAKSENARREIMNLEQKIIK